MNKISFFYCYLMILSVIGMLYFLLGFFPFKTDSLSSSCSQKPAVDVSNDPAYSPQIKRLVIMVIDGLRFDFVHGPSTSERMPFLSDLFERNKTCITKTKVEPPTVTMPRIKSLMSGTVSSFVDVLLNFGSHELHVDNVLKQASLANMKTVFYGDETWINLFPNMFYRANGTTSFFITDYTEVDDNVTYNLISELERSDWDIMVLHYLGLDHIGHLEGPYSPLIKPKLAEMDNIISLIHRKLRLDSTPGNMLLVCGDHGMKDSGGHGGTTEAEIFVPLILMDFQCENNIVEHIDQVDVSPLLSALLGLPIPTESVGQLHYRLLPGDETHKLINLYLNSHHLACMKEGRMLKFKEMEKYFLSWLNGPRSRKNVSSIVSMFESFQNSIKEHFSETNSFNLLSVMIGTLILFQVSFLFMFNCEPCFKWMNVFNSVTFSAVIFKVLSSIEPLSVDSGIILVPLIIIGFNCSVKVNYKLKLVRWDWFFLICQILHFVSIFSSSLIEEEHQVWYFIFATFCVFLLKNNKAIVFVLMLHKFLRCLNQTGDQFASLPDVGDWFAQNRSYLSVFHAVSLISLSYFTCTDLFDFTQNLLLSFFVYLQKSASGFCHSPFLLSHNGAIEFRIFLFFLFLKFFWQLYFKSKDVLSLLSDFAIYFAAVLYRPHNTILLAALPFYSNMLSKLFSNDVLQLSLIHYWLGSVFYFYLGNSNSFSNIDIAPAYTGQTRYNVVTIGCLLTFHTFSPFILSYLLLLRGLKPSLSALYRYIARTFLSVLSVQNFNSTLLLYIQREHLFVWSVFSPKLIFVYSISIVYYFLILTTFVVIFFVDYFKKEPHLSRYRKQMERRIK